MLDASSSEDLEVQRVLQQSVQPTPQQQQQQQQQQRRLVLPLLRLQTSTASTASTATTAESSSYAFSSPPLTPDIVLRYIRKSHGTKMMSQDSFLLPCSFGSSTSGEGGDTDYQRLLTPSPTSAQYASAGRLLLPHHQKPAAASAAPKERRPSSADFLKILDEEPLPLRSASFGSPAGYNANVAPQTSEGPAAMVAMDLEAVFAAASDAKKGLLPRSVSVGRLDADNEPGSSTLPQSLLPLDLEASDDQERRVLDTEVI